MKNSNIAFSFETTDRFISDHTQIHNYLKGILVKISKYRQQLMREQHEYLKNPPIKDVLQVKKLQDGLVQMDELLSAFKYKMYLLPPPDLKKQNQFGRPVTYGSFEGMKGSISDMITRLKNTIGFVKKDVNSFGAALDRQLRDSASIGNPTLANNSVAANTKTQEILGWADPVNLTESYHDQNVDFFNGMLIMVYALVKHWQKRH